MSSDTYKNMKVVVSLIDADTGKTIESKEMNVKEGENENVLARKIRKMVTSLFFPEDAGGLSNAPDTESGPKPKSKNVTNAQLKVRTDAHADVIQAMMRTLHSRGLMSDAMLKTLTGKLEE